MRRIALVISACVALAGCVATGPVDDEAVARKVVLYSKAILAGAEALQGIAALR